MRPRAFAIALYGLCGLWAPLACSFDGSGVGTSAGRDLHLIEGPADARAPDKARHDAPVPDLARIVDGRADSVTKVDPKLDFGPRAQGQSCNSGLKTIIADKVPTQGATLKLAVISREASWVMAGVSADQGQPPAKDSFAWAGGVTFTVCRKGWCQWTFPTVQVPNAPGPYTVGFMVDATGDQPKNGHIVFTCVP